jgi:transposase
MSRQRLKNILPRKRSTECFRLEVFEQHGAGVTQKHLSRTHKVSSSTVERWFWDFLQYRVKELSGRSCPKVLGIDEHFFTRKKGFATSFVDLKNHRVFDVVLGRSEKSLESYLKKLPGREQVQVVVMDLCETYRSIVRKYFPNAMIVADRFHVVKNIQHHFQKLWTSIDPVGRKSRGLLSLFRQHRGRMKPESLAKLEGYFKEFPTMKVFDEIQQQLLAFVRLKHLNQSAAKKYLPGFVALIESMKSCGIAVLETLAKTTESWAEEIVRMWRFTKSNGITEGFHNKMEMISRRAFGFRNFQNYRIRVLALCGWDGIFNRVEL